MRLWRRLTLLAAAGIGAARGYHGSEQHQAQALGECPGDFEVSGHGCVSLIPTGWGDPTASKVEVHHGNAIVPHMGGRAYFGQMCNGTYSNTHYLGLNLLGKTMRFTADVRNAGCGCNVAMYLVPMRSNPHPSECFDYYCDANDVCGESCAEIDVMEANMYSFHTTLHTQFDHEGFGGGFGGGDGWNGPRDWNSSQYSPGSDCVDTMKPFDVAVSFVPDDSGDVLAAMEVKLSQEGRDCPLVVRLSEYPGMADLTGALKTGMTPVVSYWSSDKMLWMDGRGPDGKGICKVDLPDKCADTARMSDFIIEEYVPNEEPHHARHSKASAHKAHHIHAKHKQLREVCPGDLQVGGVGSVSLVPTGWGSEGATDLEVFSDEGSIVPHMNSRAYFADSCTAGRYDNEQYLALNLLGQRLRYTVDLSGAGCGCNVAVYLVSMRQNDQPSTCNDYYCDANSVCGVPCAEIDIQEANTHAWHSTLHTQYDHQGQCAGLGGGDGWNGPRDFQMWQYGPGGQCVDTRSPFQVDVTFPMDAYGTLKAMEVTLTQEGRYCNVSMLVSNYRGSGMSELTLALKAGMTPVVSYWASKKMLWLDGAGSDGQGPCQADTPEQCSESVKLSNFSVERLQEVPQEGIKGVCVKGWVLQPECVLEFEYKHKSHKGCTREDTKTLRWCSHDANYSGHWSHCQPCEVMVGNQNHKVVDASVSFGETKATENLGTADMSAQCGGLGFSGPSECSKGAVCQYMNEWWSECAPPRVADGCYNGWKPPSGCQLEFVYDDTEFHGCATTDSHGTGWCSRDAHYEGKWLPCEECTMPSHQGQEQVHVLQRFAAVRGTIEALSQRPIGGIFLAGGLACVGLVVLARRRMASSSYRWLGLTPDSDEGVERELRADAGNV